MPSELQHESPPSSATTSPASNPRLSRRFLLLLAGACGVAVSNLYYCQPLLEQIRQNFGASAGAAGLVATLSQIGYTLGLLFLVPLGDAWRRRPLIVGLMVIEALFLAGAALSPSLAWFSARS